MKAIFRALPEGINPEKVLLAVKEAEKVSKEMRQAVAQAKSKAEAEQLLVNIAKKGEERLGKALKEYDQKEAEKMHSSSPVPEFVKDILGLDIEQEEVDCGCERSNHDFTYAFSKVVESLKPDEIAISMQNSNIQLTRLPGGGIVSPDGNPINLSPEVLESDYRIELREPKVELIAIPMHVALEAFHQGEIIVLEYKDLDGSDQTVELNPNVKKEERPHIHFDALINGIYYIKKSK